MFDKPCMMTETSSLSQRDMHWLQSNLTLLDVESSCVPQSERQRCQDGFERALSGELSAWQAASFMMDSLRLAFANRVARGGGVWTILPNSLDGTDFLLSLPLPSSRQKKTDLFFRDVAETLPNLIVCMNIDIGVMALSGNMINIFRLAASESVLRGVLICCRNVGFDLSLTSQPSSPKDFRDLLDGENPAAPLCLSPLAQEADGYPELDPYIIALHDLVHALGMKENGSEGWALKVSLYDAISQLGPDAFKQDPYQHAIVQFFQSPGKGKQEVLDIADAMAGAYIKPSYISRWKKIRATLISS